MHPHRYVHNDSIQWFCTCAYFGRTDLLVNPFLFLFRRPRRDNCPVSHSKGPHDLCPFGVGDATCPMQGFLEALHDRVRQNKTWFNMAYHHFFFCHPFWIIGCCNNLVAQTSQASFLLVKACFKHFLLALSFSVFSVFQSRSLCLRSKTAELFLFSKAMAALLVDLLSLYPRFFRSRWSATLRESSFINGLLRLRGSLKIPAGFWALAFPSCFEICFDLALSILFVHVSKVHDLDSLNDPLIEHVLLDTGSRPWKLSLCHFHTTHTPWRDQWTGGEWRDSWVMSYHHLYIFVGPAGVQEGTELSNVFPVLLQSYIGLPGSWPAWPA